MNRWKWAGLAVLVLGLFAAFVLIPTHGSCDDSSCTSYNGWRLLALLGSLMVTFLLFVVGTLSEPHKR